MRFFCVKMVKKINRLYFLDRKETVDYLMGAYDLKWCLTTWQNGKVKVSYETQASESLRASFCVFAYKVKNTKIIHLSKKELDEGMMI